MKRILTFGFILISFMLQAQTYYLNDQFGVDFDNSTQSTDQWYLDLIDAQQAWEITRGNPEVPIAYICANGVYWLHEDLGEYDDGFDNFHRTGSGSLEQWDFWNIPDDENTDEDNNGYYDDWRGIYFNGSSVTNNTLNDGDLLHSTWIAGIMSAKNHDATGIYGIAGGGSGMGNSLIISSYNYDGPTFSYVSNAINYAVQNGARVILVDGIVSYSQWSWGFIPSALQAAFNAGCFVVAPTGWNGNNQLCFPSSYNDETTGYSVFSVGASTKPDINADEYKHQMSNYGFGFNNPASNTPIDLVAPGEQIYTTSTEDIDKYLNVKGVAPAAAMVASTVGLMLSVNPDLTYIEIETILHETAEKIGQDDYYFYDANEWNEYVGYGRLNTYRAVCAALATAPPVEVVNGATWDEPVFSLNDIIIPTGYNLTVTSTVYFGEGAAFIVKPGATLTLNGGTLTNYKFCENEDLLWKGVEVWGVPTTHQYATPAGCAQGKIIILNGGVIENAEIGVLLASRYYQSWGEIYQDGGGIIQINNNGNPAIPTAVFLNNRNALRFHSYHNYLPNDPNKKEVANLSKIENCLFEADANFLPGSWGYSQIYLYDVSGILIKGCTFNNDNTSVPSGLGINAYGAGFKVEAICNSAQSPCPEEFLDKNIFTNFFKGINLLEAGTYTLSVKNAEFNGNSYGIMLSNVNNASVLFSNFNIGSNAAEQEACESEGKLASGYGIDMTSCTGFAIEENYFTKIQGAPIGTYTGIRCFNSHTRYDLIYRNTFEGLSYGNYAEGMNRDDPEDDWDGIEYQCNFNTGNSVDFEVMTNDPLTPPMIRGYMGYTNISAGNTFSQQSGVDWHFLNLGTQQIDYWWFSGIPTEEPEYYCTPPPNPYPDPCYFTPYSISTENTCPSHYGGGGSGGADERSVSLTPGQFQETEQEYLSALNDFNNVKTLYDNLRDGGNTQILNSEIETAFPSDMWQLRSELLGVSPHVSKEVLKTAAEKTDVFPESILFEILSANPDELKNGEMISFLENKEEPLPQYMIDMLKQIAGGVTYKTILKRQMSDFYATKSQAANDIIRSIIADSVTDMQLYRNWLDNLGCIGADKQIIASYIEEGDYASAQTLLDIIPSLYELDENSLLQYNDYKSLTGFIINIEQQNRNVMELDSVETDYLVDFAENSTGTARTMARGMLNYGYGYNYCDCLPADSSAMKSSAVDFESPQNDNGLEVKAKPNPADTWVAFNFKIPSYIDEAILIITDVNGNEVKRYMVDAEQGQKIWDVRNIKSGVYLYTLEAGTFKKSDKLIIK